MKKFLYATMFLLCCIGYSQKKVIQTKATKENIIIDGKIDETAWQTVTSATNFVMLEPDNGKVISDSKKTEVKILYDNEAIYVAALLYDNEPTKILKEITKRDDFGTADRFGVFINGYNDGQQDFRFIVSASDGQADCVASDNTNEDYSWDAVWKSKSTVTDFGWVVEMKIPYAALRFSEEKKQTWGINFFRDIRRENQKYTWNFVDTKLRSFTQQAGLLEGIENIKTPTRLFLLPYSSFYLNANAKQKTYGTLKGGLDLKYGINDAFTLDMILIPDFGQTKVDEKILNLGPFEQRYNENRSFFTEGTDLFNKGNLVYSRRIGGNPTKSPSPTETEKVIESPANVSLLNAFKISGRTKTGLGIGIMNAVTKKTIASLQDTITGKTRTELLEPLSNYSVLVLDQRFNQNSSFSFVNTNVTRDGDFRDANVSGLVWNLNTQKNTYNFTGDLKYSFVNNVKDKKGINTSLNFGETSGNYRYSVGGTLVTKDFDNNDLGINFRTNYYTIKSNFNYRILNPTSLFNTFRYNINTFNQFNKETGKIQENEFSLSTNFRNKQNNDFGFELNYTPIETYDYYETRAENRFLIKPKQYGANAYISSNYNNKFAVDANSYFAILDEIGRKSYGFEFGPRFRINDQILVEYRFNYSKDNNNKGRVDAVDEDQNSSTPKTIIFANRDVVTFSNTFSGRYSVNSQMTFDLKLRHYWAYAENKKYLTLEQNGRLTDNLTYDKNKNSSYNAWNLDLSYSWWFAPGSQVSVLYRNNAAVSETDINKKFNDNVTNLLNNDKLSHAFSISVKYFIDYNSIKHVI
jgi:hypothetical protein